MFIVARNRQVSYRRLRPDRFWLAQSWEVIGLLNASVMMLLGVLSQITLRSSKPLPSSFLLDAPIARSPKAFVACRARTSFFLKLWPRDVGILVNARATVLPPTIVLT
jgi:hypothetical protein